MYRHPYTNILWHPEAGTPFPQGRAPARISPLLMSANAFWKNGRFRGHEILWKIEVPFALDCGGYTAMKAYGCYRWAIWDYVAQMEHCLFGDAAYIEGMGHDGWPDLVGVGSVCRKRLLGEDGLMRVLDTLEGVLPTHVRLHLFGVKSAAVSKLKDRPRVASVDSMAWNAARWEAFQTNQPKGKAFLNGKNGTMRSLSRSTRRTEPTVVTVALNSLQFPPS
jgi:hypothetical protein